MSPWSNELPPGRPVQLHGTCFGFQLQTLNRKAARARVRVSVTNENSAGGHSALVGSQSPCKCPSAARPGLVLWKVPPGRGSAARCGQVRSFPAARVVLAGTKLQVSFSPHIEARGREVGDEVVWASHRTGQKCAARNDIGHQRACVCPFMASGRTILRGCSSQTHILYSHYCTDLQGHPVMTSRSENRRRRELWFPGHLLGANFSDT